MTTQEIVRTNGAQEVEHTFGSVGMAQRTETASLATAASEETKIKAMYVYAERHPRDWMQVRAKLLDACKRPGFAASARYSKPVSGQPIEGPSVRFAEEALRSMGNVSPTTTVIYDDESKRIVRVAVTDLESNLHYAMDVSVEKTIERSALKGGQVPIGKRKNSYGKDVYILPATDDDVANKVNAAVSKALRNMALRVLPSDILEECMDACIHTQRSDAAQDPAAAAKKVADAFRSLRVMPEQLAEYLGHPVDQSSPAEIVDLRAVFQAIRDGETTWIATLEERGKRPTSGVKERVKARTVEAVGEPVPTRDAPPQREPGEEG